VAAKAARDKVVLAEVFMKFLRVKPFGRSPILISPKLLVDSHAKLSGIAYIPASHRPER
jgi:hypothetical protein